MARAADPIGNLDLILKLGLEATGLLPRRGRGKAKKTMALIHAIRAILQEIQPATVRAVCYRLFVAGLINSMAKAETNKVSTQLTWARENGIIPWNWVVDETREAESVNAWDNPAEYVECVGRSYRRNRWADQSEWIEVWSEKGTIRGTLAPVLNDYGLTFRVMHGYGSATALYQVAQDTISAGRELTVFYVGDWDPSGMHMSQVDLPTRIREYGGTVHINRLALTDSDISSGLPYFTAESKRKDPRHGWYVKRYGQRCWELDALSPVILRQRLEDAVVARIEPAAWNRHAVAERAERESLTNILGTWPGISGQASKYSTGEEGV